MGSKLKATFCLGMMFVLGTVSGAVVEFYMAQRGYLHSGYASHRVKSLKAELSLTPAQEQALEQIFKNAHERAKEVNEEVSWDLTDIHKDSVDAIRGVLSPEQNQKFEKLHHKTHTARRPTGPHSGPGAGPDEDGENS